MRRYLICGRTETRCRMFARDVLLCGLFLSAHGLLATSNARAEQTSYTFVVKPYLQLGNAPYLLPEEQMVVSWHTADVDAQWIVEYRNDEHSDWQPADLPTWSLVAVDSVSPHRIYRARIGELIPGKEFFYRVKQSGKTVFSASGRARRPRSESHRCAVMGDCGTGSEGQRNVAYQVYQAKPDYLLIPGDIVYMNGRITEYNRWVFPIYNYEEADPEYGAPLFRSVPLFGGLGQHDYGQPLDVFPDGFDHFMVWSFPLNGPVRQASDSHAFPLGGTPAMRKATLAATGDRYPVMANYSFDYGNAHWTVLDSWNPHIDWTDQALRDWLTNDLAETDATWKFVSSYLPPFNSSTQHPNTQKMRVVVDILQQHDVDIVFCGYAHSYQRTYPLEFTAKPTPSGPVKSPGHEIPGQFNFDREFDGKQQTSPQGII